MTTDSSRDGYLPHLDALRAFAVMAVACAHWVPLPYQFNIRWGSAGVQLFFVLSGFLITGQLLVARQSAGTTPQKLLVIRNFVIRRGLRIFPAYYLVLALAYAWGLWPFRDSIVWHLFYGSNFYLFGRQEWAGAASHLWTLAVEEQFYLFWPWVVVLATAWVARVTGLLVAASVLVLLVTAAVRPELRLLGVLPIPAFFAIGVGALLALSKQPASGVPGVVPGVSMWCGVVAVVIFIGRGIFGIGGAVLGQVQWILFVASFGWIVHRAALGFSGRFGRICSNRFLLHLGKISYGLYLFHNFAPSILAAIGRGIPLPVWVATGAGGFAMKALITFGCATVSWRLIERRANGLKKHFPSSPRGAVTVVSTHAEAGAEAASGVREDR